MIKKITILLLVLLITAVLGVVVHHYMTTPWQEGVCTLKTVSSVPYLYAYDIVNFYWTSERNPDIPDISGNSITCDGRKILFSVPFKHRNLNGCLFDRGQSRYTLYADLNGNGSLTDEKPVVSQKKSDSFFLFGPLSLTDETTKNAPFYLFLSNFTAGIHIGPATIKKGKIKLNGNIHDLMLADLDFDGQYKTHFSPEYLKDGGLWSPAVCDRLLFDIDGDKKFIDCHSLRYENLPLPKLIRLDKQFYSINISEKKLLASPVTPAMGTLKINTHESSMHLYSDTYPCFIDLANTAQLPTGNYSVIYSQNHIKDKQGDIWTWCFKRSGSAADVTMVANQETTLEFPTSFTLKTSVDYKDGKCGIRIRLFSDNSKEYTPLFQKNDENIQKPKLTILDENDTAIHTGTMEYG